MWQAFFKGTKTRDLVIAFAFACVLGSAVVWLSLNHPKLTGMLAGIFALCCFLVTIVSLPIASVLLMIALCRNWLYWNNVKDKYRVFNKPTAQWQYGTEVYGTPQSKFQITARFACDSAGLYLAPSQTFPADILKSFDPTDSFSAVVAVLLYLPLALPLALFAFVFRPVQIPWSEVKTLREQNDRLVVELADTMLELRVPQTAFQCIKQNLPAELLRDTLSLYEKQQERELYRSYYAELSESAKDEDSDWSELSEDSAAHGALRKAGDEK